MRTRHHEVDKDLFIIEADEAINDDLTEAIIDQLEADIDAGKHAKIIVDCSQVQFLSSFGLSMIMRLRNAARQAKAEIKLAGVSPIIQEMLRMTRMEQHFNTYPDVEQARDSFHLRPR